MTVAAESPSTSEPAEQQALEPFDSTLDHFARLGLERGWALDRSALEDAYLARSRRYHPDRHAGADSATRRAALEHSSALNEGYRVLRDRVRRAEYLVKLAGTDLDSSDPHTGAPHPEQSFLIDMIERREQLASSTGADALGELHEAIEDELEQVFDGATAALERGDTKTAASGLVHRRYLQRLHDEVGAALEQLEADTD